MELFVIRHDRGKRLVLIPAVVRGAAEGPVRTEYANIVRFLDKAVFHIFSGFLLPLPSRVNSHFMQRMQWIKNLHDTVFITLDLRRYVYSPCFIRRRKVLPVFVRICVKRV